MNKAKIYRKGYFWTGIAILALSIASYLIKFNVDAGPNYITRDSLLGVIIFHNPFLLALLILIIIIFLALGLKKKK